MRHAKWMVSGFAVFVLGAWAPGCGLLPKKLSDKECEEFAKHAMTVVKKEIKNAAKKCPDGGDMFVEAIEKKEDKQIDKIADDCKSDMKAGKRIVAKEYDCFMKGESFEDWRKCEFKDKEFKDADEKLEEATKMVEKACKKAGGDDDDGGKKKKKKKDDDD